MRPAARGLALIAETDDDGSVARVITRHRDADDHQESLRQVVRAFLARPLPA